jgi:hypothetical protein
MHGQTIQGVWLAKEPTAGASSLCRSKSKAEALHQAVLLLQLSRA